MRKCNHSSLDYVDTCSHSCSHYIWDGTTTEYFKQSSSSYGSSSGSSCFSTFFGGLIGIAVSIGLGFLVISLAISGFERLIGKDEDKSTTAVVESVSNEKYATVTPSAGLRLRNGAGTSYQKILTMPQGARVRIIKEDGEWAYVEYDGIKGWCSKEYLNSD